MFSKVIKISDFQILFGWVEKYKPALSKLDSSWDNTYCIRLVIVLLVVLLVIACACAHTHAKVFRHVLNHTCK